MEIVTDSTCTGRATFGTPEEQLELDLAYVLSFTTEIKWLIGLGGERGLREEKRRQSTTIPTRAGLGARVGGNRIDNLAQLYLFKRYCNSSSFQIMPNQKALST